MKYLKQLIICLTIINNNLQSIINIWNKEVNENDGFINPNINNSLEKCYSNSYHLLTLYSHILYTRDEANNLIKSIYNLMSINKNRKKDVIKYGYDYKFERDNLPTNLFDNTYAIAHTLNYINEKLNIEIKRQKLDKEIDDLTNEFEKYMKFTEDELILNLYEIKGGK